MTGHADAACRPTARFGPRRSGRSLSSSGPAPPRDRNGDEALVRIGPDPLCGGRSDSPRCDCTGSPPARAASRRGAALRPLALSARSGRTARCCVRVKASLSHAGIEQGRTAASPRGSERPVRAEPYARFWGAAARRQGPSRSAAFTKQQTFLCPHRLTPKAAASVGERPRPADQGRRRWTSLAAGQRWRRSSRPALRAPAGRGPGPAATGVCAASAASRA